jgi:hypothetical protein
VRAGTAWPSSAHFFRPAETHTIHVYKKSPRAAAGQPAVLDLKSAGSPLPDMAECTVAGRRFVAEAQSGSICAICRQLLDAGIADQAWEAFNTSWRMDIAALTGPSIHAMARFVVEENPRRGVRFRKRLQGGVKAPPKRAGDPAAITPAGTNSAPVLALAP